MNDASGKPGSFLRPRRPVFVESYALGPVFATRVRDMVLAFTQFLEDGCRQRLRSIALPLLAASS